MEVIYLLTIITKKEKMKTFRSEQRLTLNRLHKWPLVPTIKQLKSPMQMRWLRPTVTKKLTYMLEMCKIKHEEIKKSLQLHTKGLRRQETLRTKLRIKLKTKMNLKTKREV